MITTDILIIGAGPVGLFTVFEAGLLKMHCHLVDALPQIGGQLSEIYPKKPIYDIPGFPMVMAEDLVKGLMIQAEPFKPTFTLGERVETFARNEDGTFVVTTSENTEIHCKVICIAGGLGCFEPRKPELEGLERFEGGKGIAYMILDPEKYRNKRMVIAGAGDSALDWTIFLADVASEVHLVHRSKIFRGAPDSVEKVTKLAEEGKIKLYLDTNLAGLEGDSHLQTVHLTDKEGNRTSVATDYLIPLFGLTPKLGPIEQWGLNLDKNAINVNVHDYSTNVPGIYAIGDINNYPGKLKLILCGFHEAALMCQGAHKYLYPEQKITLKYTTVNGVQGF